MRLFPTIYDLKTTIDDDDYFKGAVVLPSPVSHPVPLSPFFMVALLLKAFLSPGKNRSPFFSPSSSEHF